MRALTVGPLTPYAACRPPALAPPESAVPVDGCRPRLGVIAVVDPVPESGAVAAAAGFADDSAAARAAAGEGPRWETITEGAGSTGADTGTGTVAGSAVGEAVAPAAGTGAGPATGAGAAAATDADFTDDPGAGV